MLPSLWARALVAVLEPQAALSARPTQLRPPRLSPSAPRLPVGPALATFIFIFSCRKRGDHGWPLPAMSLSLCLYGVSSLLLPSPGAGPWEMLRPVGSATQPYPTASLPQGWEFTAWKPPCPPCGQPQTQPTPSWNTSSQGAIPLLPFPRTWPGASRVASVVLPVSGCTGTVFCSVASLCGPLAGPGQAEDRPVSWWWAGGAAAHLDGVLLQVGGEASGEQSLRLGCLLTSPASLVGQEASGLTPRMCPSDGARFQQDPNSNRHY